MCALDKCLSLQGSNLGVKQTGDMGRLLLGLAAAARWAGGGVEGWGGGPVSKDA